MQKINHLYLIALLSYSLNAGMMERAVKDWSQNTQKASAVEVAPPEPVVRPTITRYPLAAQPNWQQAQPIKKVKQVLRAAHFGIKKRSATSKQVSMTMHIGTPQDDGSHAQNLSVTITQNQGGSTVLVRDANGKQVKGSVPQLEQPVAYSPTPLLPWFDDTEVLYSVLVQGLEVAVVVHTRNKVFEPGNSYKPFQVQSMLDRYVSSGVLADLPHAYRDRVEHMRVLPVSYRSTAYKFSADKPLVVAWSSPDDLVATPR